MVKRQGRKWRADGVIDLRDQKGYKPRRLYDRVTVHKNGVLSEEDNHLPI